MATARLSELWRSLANVLEPVRVVSGLVTELVLMRTPQNKLGRSWLRSAQQELSFSFPIYCRSLRTAAGAALACARAAIEDCSKVCALVRLAAAAATSASRIADCAEEKLVIWELARAVA